MMEEEKTTQLEPEVPETPAQEEQEAVAAESAETKGEKAVREELCRQKSGRVMVTGLVTATIVTLVAVVVVGIFQLTSRWLTSCPRDRTANGPASILWKETVSDKATPQTLGVPEKLLQTTKFKTSAAVGQASGQGKKEDQ